jgi:hypothetical protein
VAKVDQLQLLMVVIAGCFHQSERRTGLANTIAMVTVARETNTPAKICYDLTLNGSFRLVFTIVRRFDGIMLELGSLSFVSGAVYWTSSMHSTDNNRAFLSLPTFRAPVLAGFSSPIFQNRCEKS